ncbi:Integrase core domain-containing protein [Variovorax sp. YR266]|uniref:DDE-type integrase/transposase/recombinase n=1 Tax=Variovorax sp. YR266 TaxID=1884386 RepID=UPI000895BA3E|nr:DDE-type integrase/transposase/recombinase [Variovorax sp. YR266]SDY32829.1 Integrase core domain-containing protein [Variovorax sp. YR266]
MEDLSFGLAFNATIKIDDASGIGGIYRVVFADKLLDEIALARLDAPNEEEKPSRGGRRKAEQTKKPRKKPPMPLVGKLKWESFERVSQLLDADLARTVHIESDRIDLPIAGTEDHKIFATRCSAMEPFLDFDNFKTEILASRGISSLVRAACEKSGLSEPAIYKYFSLLCRLGFVDLSLVSRKDRCGAPGKVRRVDPDTAEKKGREKAGRKTNSQRIEKLITGTDMKPEQPGMSTQWANMILAADDEIPCPKPAMPRRCRIILEKRFVTKLKEIDGTYTPVNPEKGTYPTAKQIRRVLEETKPLLLRALELTTKGHYQRSMRSMTGKSWQGVAGPGHTWAVDSTIADMYLRSTVNRAWIIGRPIVYIFVDIWSTAIVGFLVCLEGPSWAMAKQGLFSCLAQPDLMNSIRGFEAIQSLAPYPTLPVYLLCDRGEYLSKGASETAFGLKLSMQYAPPYRPDLKGLVEVLHRIQKDQQFLFIPGAIDRRRAELELRNFDMRKAVYTLPEYVNYLSICFANYNLTANRASRLDVEMIAAGVRPSPGGLWHFGHSVGIGTTRAMNESDLITKLLPSGNANVTRHGIKFGGLEYVSSIATELQWTGLARNFGAWGMNAHHYTGSVSRVWAPNPLEHGMMEMHLSDYTRATPENSWDEVRDAFVYHTLPNHDRQHDITMANLDMERQMQALLDAAKERTREALAAHSGPVPSSTEARAMEHSSTPALVVPAARNGFSKNDAVHGLFDTQNDMAAKLLDLMNMSEDQHAV